MLAFSRNFGVLVLLFSKHYFNTIEVFVYVEICVICLTVAQLGLGEISGSGIQDETVAICFALPWD